LIYRFDERKKPLILVVDDELVGRIYIEKALESEGYEVITAENGQHALELTTEHAPNMVVMDVLMPVMDGYTACKAIRAKEKGLHIPIMMLTGLDDIESVEKSFESGATDFVIKPVNLPIFKQRVRHGLKTLQTDLELYKQQLRQSHANKVAKMGYWDWEIESDHLYWSEEVYDLLDVKPDEFANNREALKARIFPEDHERLRHATVQSLRYGIPYRVEFKVKRPDQTFQVVYQDAELIRDDQGKVVRMLGIVQDITEQHLARKKIHHQYYYDTLTDLPNRILFHERLEHALERPGRSDNRIAVILINLDRFKNINESYGHKTGDQFLKLIANELRQAVRSTDTLSRLGADEFALIIEGVGSSGSIGEIAGKLLETLKKTHLVDDNELITTGSIGIALSSSENCDKDTLIRQAELALNHAKKVGGNQFFFFNEEMKSRALQSLNIEKELRHALENDELVVFYQPKVCVQTGRIKGMEALIRWQHPERGLVPPFEFIPVAENTGLIIPIGKQVLEKACQQTKRWHQKGYTDLVVSVNVSVKQFLQQNFAREVEEVIASSGLPPAFVDLEITESCTMNNIETAITLLNTFREMGLLISMDDFGTGFSSLSFLNQLPLDTLKIDRAFIKDINENHEHGELARLIITMAKTLNLHTVAEGVEEPYHLDFLQQLGCDEYQGFFLSPPVPAKEFEVLLSVNEQKLAEASS